MARPGKVVTKQGQTFEGDVTERKDKGEIDIVRPNGERVTLNANNVRQPIQYDAAPVPGVSGDAPAPGAGAGAPEPGSTQELFQKRLAALGPRDVVGRITLARWAFERKEYDLAKQAASDAIQIDPRNQEARDLLLTIDAQRKLQSRTPPQGQGQPGNRPAPGGVAVAPEGAHAQPGQPHAATGEMPRPLTADEVNLIRQREWSRNDKNVKVRFQNDVKKRYLARARDVRPADFNNMNAVEQGWQIVRKGTEDMANDVRLTTDPLPLHEFKTIVQRAVLPGCAAAACHGGGPAGNFQLYPRADRDPELYANFLTLSTYTRSSGEGKEARKAQMIDRDRPADSLLMQYALPQNLSDNPHPDVPGFKPMFRTLKDPKYDQFLRWISNDLAPLQRDYGIDLGQPRGGADGHEQPQGAPQQGAPQPGSPQKGAPQQGAPRQPAPPAPSPQRGA
jgi:hypothetical protein